MAIEANPQAAFMAAYQLGDNSQRAWQELALRQQEAQRLQAQQARAAMQQAVENKREEQAFDFKRQLAVLQDDRQRREDERMGAYQAAQARTGQINAATSRYEAIIRARQLQNQNRNYGDPYGLGGSQDLSVPGMDIPTVSDTPGEFSFGGRRYAGDWGPAGVSVFGGPNDPEDNGLSAFGGRTGPGGREGVAVPESVLRQTLGNDRRAWEKAGVAVTLNDGTTRTLPIADLGTAESVWQRNGGPVLDMTPGALESLGGQVIYDRNGQQRGARGVDIANVRVVPSVSQEMVPAPVAESPPDLAVPATMPTEWVPPSQAVVRTAAVDLPVPEVPPPSADDGLLPPPVQPVSLGSADLTRGLSDQLFQLQRDNRRLAVEGAQAKTYATGLQRTLPRVAPGLRDRYQQEIAQANAVAQKAEAQEFAARRELDRREKELPVLQKRQDALTGLTALDGVLPPQEVQTLMREAGDIRTGGAADRKINVLSAYGKVREQQGLDYPSRGLATAEQVARTGAQLVSPEGIKARDAAETYAAYQRLLDQDTANPEMKTETKIGLRTEMAKLLPGNEKWKQMREQFQQAVLNDQAAVPSTDAPPSTAVDTPAPAARDIFAAGTTPQMSQPAQEEWSTAKNAVLSKLGGMTGVQSRIAAGVKTLEDFKQQLRAQVWAAVRPPGPLGEPGDTRELDPKDIGIKRLPENAQLTEDVVDALAEDIWRATGRGVNDKVVAGTPGVSAEGRKLIDSIPK